MALEENPKTPVETMHSFELAVYSHANDNN